MSDPPLVAIRQLTCQFGDGETPPILEHVDFEVRAGERIVLEGPSGCGKSTLLRCLIGLEARRTGEILWRGEPVEGRAIRRLRRRVAHLPQEPVDIAGTVEDNLAFARQMAEEADELSTEPLDRDAQYRLLEHLGLQDLDDERAFDRLSVGERQRVALVRTMTLQSPVLLLDEPTAALDETSADRVEAHLLDYVDARSDRALVWVTHETTRGERMATRTVSLGASDETST
jgi:ABC-type iron transport system FetAB ATPase subunit